MITASKRVLKSPDHIAFWGSIGALILVSYWWRLHVLDAFPFNYDEGIHLILGKLWAAGYAPYEEIFVSYPPSFLWSLGIPWKVFTQPVALQFLMTTYALTGVIAVAYLGLVYKSRLAGIVAGVMLSFTPAYFIASFSIMGEVPSIGIVVVAIAFAEKYRRSGTWVWVLLAGGVLAFGLSVKILPFFAVPFLGVMVISRHVEHWTTLSRDLRASGSVLLRDLAILTSGFIAVFLLPIFFFNVSAFYEQVVAMRLVSRNAQYNPFESNNRDIINFLFANSGLTALALYGLVFVVARDLSRYWQLLIWFILVWVSLYFHVPLRGKHLPIFLPILAILSGFAVSHICDFLKQIRQESASPRLLAMVLTIIVTLSMFAWNVPQAIADNNGLTIDVSVNQERLDAIAFIDRIAAPDDCVIADNPVFLYQTQRLPPPELSETSQTRIDTGHLTLTTVIEAVQSHKCHVFAVVTPRFGESIPGLPEWLADNYLGLYAQDQTFVYFAKRGADRNYVPVKNGSFGNIVKLYGLQLSERPWYRGDKGYLSLFWQLESPMVTAYYEKIVLRSVSTGEQVHQMTRLPFEGLYSPAEWRIHDRLKDTVRLDLPPDLPAGVYEIHLSVCSTETEACLPVNDQGHINLKLGQIVVQPALRALERK